jgi:hypothetical protein
LETVNNLFEELSPILKADFILLDLIPNNMVGNALKDNKENKKTNRNNTWNNSLFIRIGQGF